MPYYLAARVLSAFFTIYLVSLVGLSLSQRSQRAVTKSGRVLLASFSQFPTLSCTYFALSDFNLSNIGKYTSGFSFKAPI